MCILHILLTIHKWHPLYILGCRHTGVRGVSTPTSHMVWQVWVHIWSLYAPKLWCLMIMLVTTISRVFTAAPFKVRPLAPTPASSPPSMASTERIIVPAALILNLAFMYRLDLGQVWLGCRILHHRNWGQHSWRGRRGRLRWARSGG